MQLFLIRIRIETKSKIRVLIKINLDPQHCGPVLFRWDAATYIILNFFCLCSPRRLIDKLHLEPVRPGGRGRLHVSHTGLSLFNYCLACRQLWQRETDKIGSWLDCFFLAKAVHSAVTPWADKFDVCKINWGGNRLLKRVGILSAFKYRSGTHPSPH